MQTTILSCISLFGLYIQTLFIMGFCGRRKCTERVLGYICIPFYLGILISFGLYIQSTFLGIFLSFLIMGFICGPYCFCWFGSLGYICSPLSTSAVRGLYGAKQTQPIESYEAEATDAYYIYQRKRSIFLGFLDWLVRQQAECS